MKHIMLTGLRSLKRLLGVGSAQGQVLWITGLPGSGKTTLAFSIADELKHRGVPVEILDGDLVRKRFPPIGFSKEDRLLNMRRVAEEAARLEKEGFTVIVSLISPYSSGRAAARSLCRNFFELYLSTPLQVCISRDPKGLYKRALAGEITNFTGVSDVYEIPENPDLDLNTDTLSVEECRRRILALLS